MRTHTQNDTQVLVLDRIRRDGGTQPRVAIDTDTVAGYAEDYLAGAELPPAVVFFDGKDYWLADGFHRWYARQRAGLDTMPCEVRQGTVEDARWFAAGANIGHGLRRTNADKRLAIQMALKGRPHASDRAIAEQCGVHPDTVGEWRKRLSESDSQPIVRIGRDGRSIDTSNIGRRPDPQPEADEPAYITASDPHTSGCHADMPGRFVHVSANTGNNEWYTPPDVLAAVREVLGRVDLDPASSEVAQQFVRARRYFTLDDDGLSRMWKGSIFLNPPYAADLVRAFLGKLVEHFQAGDVPEAVVLVNNATETTWFQAAARTASAVCFPSGRIKFLDQQGQPVGAPLQGQALLYFGASPDAFVAAFRSLGSASLWECAASGHSEEETSSPATSSGTGR